MRAADMAPQTDHRLSRGGRVQRSPSPSELDLAAWLHLRFRHLGAYKVLYPLTPRAPESPIWVMLWISSTGPYRPPYFQINGTLGGKWNTRQAAT